MSSEEQNIKVVIITEGESESKAVYDTGIIMAQIFKAQVVWLHITQQKIPKQKGVEATETVQLIQHHYLAHNEIHQLYGFCEEQNGFICIMEVSKKLGKLNTPKNVLKLAMKSRIPFLFIQNSAPKEINFKNIVLPIDFQRQSKEKALWASYFSAFNQSIIHVLSATYKDEYYRSQSKNNLVFVERMFENLGTLYQKTNFEKAGFKIDRVAIEYAAKNNFGSVVILGTSDYNIDDMIFGPPELKLIQNPYQIPIIYLNPRSDLFVLCH